VKGPADVGAVEITPVASEHAERGCLPEKFTDKDVRESFLNGRGSTLEQIADRDGEVAVMQSDPAVRISVLAKVNVYVRHRRAWIHEMKNARVNLRHRLEEQSRLDLHFSQNVPW
jgi:hypothetical protein